jgi:alpha-glucosidase
MQRSLGGKRKFSIKVIQGRFKTRMATESAICPESSVVCPNLRDLGVDAIWLSPIFPSPMADFGYDVSNYLGIDPIFGTLDDFDRLVAAAHASDLKVILDLVPNHTSDQHPWFIESRSSRDDPKRDWYLWREPRADGTAPNNWMSEFGGSAWSFDAGTRQYYYHAFLREQPDLNWRNPAVRQAIYDVMRFGFGKVSTVFASMCSGI